MNKIYKITNRAKEVWNYLNGVFIVYKPPEKHFLQVRSTIILNLCRDLNQMEPEPPLKYINIVGPTDQELSIEERESYAQHPLVIGPLYEPTDFKLATANLMSVEASGVLLCGVNKGTSMIYKIKRSKLTKFYRLKGIFGQARTDDFATGKILEKSTWKHIKRHQVDRICASLQASHQKKMFELSGVDMQSQTAYELAVKGLIRTADPHIPIIYSIKCVEFKPPEFTLEIVCINEDDKHLKAIVSELGFKLKSTAYCNYIQCTQIGLFNVKDALLSKYWDLQSIINNISHCNNILSENPYMLDQTNPHLIPQTKTTEEQSI